VSAAKITIKLQQLLPSCNVETLHKQLLCFTEHTLKRTENKALRRSSVKQPLQTIKRHGNTNYRRTRKWYFHKN